jgi:signal transduction histidine kinase
MLPFEVIGVLIATIGNILLGLFTLLKNYKSATGRLFFCFTLVLALYIGLNHVATIQTTNLAADFWVRLVMTNALLVNLFFFLLVDTFPRPKIHMNAFVFWASIFVTVLLFPLTLTHLVFSSITVQQGVIKSIPGLGMPAFLLHTVVFLGGGFLLLIQRFRKSRGIEKVQMRFFLAGTIFMFLSLLITNLVLVVVFNNAAFVALLPVYTLVFVGCISYSIARHQFLDISFFVARAVVYTVLIALTALIFPLVIYLLSRTFFEIHFSNNELIVLISIIVVISLTFQQMRRVIESFTDRIFFQGRYETDEVLNSLSHIMASTLRLEDLTHGLLEVLLRQLRISRGAIIVTQGELVVDVLSQGYDPFPTLVESEIKRLTATRNLINIDEVEDEGIKSIMKSLDASVLVHLRTEGAQIGLLVLGAKLSGDIYSHQDLSLFDILAPEAAVAVQNSFAYEEIRRFNITLQDEVDRATEDLRLANVKLQDLDKLKDEFVSLASHELRTPLTAIRSYIWMTLSGKGGEINEKQKYYLERASVSTDRLIRLVNGMLNISRIESGRMAMHVSRVNMAEFVGSVLDEIRPKLAELKLHIDVREIDSLLDVAADADKIHEVLMNFIGNAMKFTPQDGTITIDVHKKEDFVCVDVYDTGMGIAADDLGKLFTKFGALRTGATPEAIAVQSTGLGLYISKTIITMHGGRVYAASEGLGKGSTFSFSLPLYTEQKQKELQARYSSDGLGLIRTTIE